MADLDDNDVLAPGALQGPWRIEAELGRGRMSIVYAVVHEQLGTRAALKIMHRRYASNTRPEHVLTGARLITQIHHPNIVEIFEIGVLDDFRPYLVMEQLDGHSLAIAVESRKLGSTEVLDVLLQICDALITAHAAGVVHRDLEPENVFLVNGSSQRVKVLDWGIARLLVNGYEELGGEPFSTPCYVAPEQLRGYAGTTKSDVYSLGVMAYRLLLGQLPFEADTVAEIMVMQLHDTPPLPSLLWPGIPQGLEDLVVSMLMKEPERRPAMAEVASRLRMARDLLEQRRRRFPLASSELRLGPADVVVGLLRSLPAVVDAAVVSDGDHIDHVFIVTNQPMNQDEVLEACRNRLPERWCPRAVTLMTDPTSGRRS